VASIAILLAGAALLSWTTIQTYKAERPAAVSTFDVAVPADPVVPVREVKPRLEKAQTEQQQPRSVQPILQPIVTPMPTASPPAVTKAPSEPAPDPKPVVKEATAPEAKPLPPAPAPSNAAATWQGRILAALYKVRRYPREAAFRRQQGVPYIRFTINRDGRVLSARLEQSSGSRSLDAEALSLPKRAQPLPKPPEDVRGETIELVVPVEFFMAAG
jgi:protein TonB